MNALALHPRQRSRVSRGAACGTRLGLMLEYQKSPDPGTAYRAAGAVAIRGNEIHNARKAGGWARDGVHMCTHILNPGTRPPSGLARHGNKFAVMRLVAAALTLALSALSVAQPVVPVEVASVVSGGAWERGAAAGGYRVVITSNGWEHVWSQLHVEWVLYPQAREEEQRVVARVEPSLPFAQGTHVLAAQIVRGKAGRTEVLVTAQYNNEIGSKPKRLRLLLGEPGQVEVRAGVR